MCLDFININSLKSQRQNITFKNVESGGIKKNNQHFFGFPYQSALNKASVVSSVVQVNQRILLVPEKRPKKQKNRANKTTCENRSLTNKCVDVKPPEYSRYTDCV